MEIWTGWWDLGLPWDVIYTDFSKAFDSVPHKRLLAKIHAFGIRGDVLKWIECFLSQRKQRVVIGSEFSDWQPVTSGIPQGSVLGPILFTIFINDMPDVVSSFKKLFADDTKIFRAIESLDDISGIQEDINKLFEWSVKWQLPFNIGKCKVIHYGKDISLKTIILIFQWQCCKFQWQWYISFLIWSGYPTSYKMRLIW